MEQETFGTFIEDNATCLKMIRKAAWDLHKNVNQTYGGVHPYGYHLSMVAGIALNHAFRIIENKADILPVVFAAFFHDSIEDARLTYNDVKAMAREYMNEAQAHTAAEIVYALTNEKGRTREERAGERYYEGIRQTSYAPFVKMCDRMANMAYSFQESDSDNNRMREVYAKEWPRFLEKITVRGDDARFGIPQEMIAAVEELLAM